MKKILFMLLFAIPNLGYAQTNDHALLQLFGQENTPISKNYISQGSFESINIDVVKLTDLTTDKIYGGVRFSMSLTGKVHSNIIDKGEVQLFAKTLKKFIGDSTINQRGYVELTSSNGFQFKITNLNEIHSWSYSLVINKARPNISFSFGKEGLAMLVEKLDLVIAAIKDEN